MYLARLRMLVGLALLVGTGILFHETLTNKPLLAQSAGKSIPGEKVVRATKDSLTPESFGRFHKLLQPEAGEYRWDEVSWMTSIWHARKKAAAENKPIFIFGTQGAGFNDPLGNC